MKVEPTMRDAECASGIPVHRVAKVIELQPNTDYPKITPKGGTGKGIWIR